MQFDAFWPVQGTTAMTLIRYRVWKFPPSWKDVLPLGEFDFYVTALLEIVDANIRNFETHPALHQCPARVSGNRTLLGLRGDLRALPDGVTVWNTGDDDRIWWLVNTLVFDGSWQKVRCHECQRDYIPDQCKTEDWSIGESLFAEGGRLLKCPQNHLLCRSREWDS